MHELLKFTIFILLSAVLASPIDGLQSRDTFVWGSLGDSWASGISFDGKNTDYDNNANGCLRWKDSYGPLMEANATWTTKPQTFHFAACSGAQLVNIKQETQNSNPAQMDQVGNPVLLTYQAGGNNLGLGKVVTDCIYPLPLALSSEYSNPYPDPDGQCVQDMNAINGYINDMRTDPTPGNHGLYYDELATVRDVLGHAAVKNNPDFRLYILGFAHFFNLGTNYCDNLSFVPRPQGAVKAGSHPPNVTNQLRTDFNDVITRVNNILQKVANDVDDSRAKFIDISSAFDSHRFCEDHHNEADQWFNNDVWLWNLNSPSQDPPNSPSSLTNAWIINGTMPDGISINGTVGVEGTGGGIPFVQRAFHPKTEGSYSIGENLMLAAMADKIPGVLGATSAASPPNSSPCVSITLDDCVYHNLYRTTPLRSYSCTYRNDAADLTTNDATNNTTAADLTTNDATNNATAADDELENGSIATSSFTYRPITTVKRQALIK
ncbi:hypothetical protein OIDMADRAFT_56640 [Oidiodendron maius Zn]|uniref:SGNH hydrolase-type esterase domain-containing protein n=1 Tax=Oidiodendron maius (strain Zn) TaxID=913774 RepID=A0A0C3H772_OIDMZ|nr:hypothetical protein OIDMADRAFT_56640 [Oidiodendron maius Zn]